MVGLVLIVVGRIVSCVVWYRWLVGVVVGVVSNFGWFSVVGVVGCFCDFFLVCCCGLVG